MGIIRNSTNHYHRRPEVNPSGFSYLIVLPCTLVAHLFTLTCWHNNELKL